MFNVENNDRPITDSEDVMDYFLREKIRREQESDERIRIALNRGQSSKSADTASTSGRSDGENK